MGEFAVTLGRQALRYMLAVVGPARTLDAPGHLQNQLAGWSGILLGRARLALDLGGLYEHPAPGSMQHAEQAGRFVAAWARA